MTVNISKGYIYLIYAVNEFTINAKIDKANINFKLLINLKLINKLIDKISIKIGIYKIDGLKNKKKPVIKIIGQIIDLKINPNCPYSEKLLI